MKRSLIWMSLLALMSVGVVHADTNTAPTQRDTTRFDLTCSFAKPGFECEALSRIFLSRSDAQAQSAQPAWFGNLLSVACNPVVPGAVPSLISASDATLFRVTGDDGVRWEIFNSDSTVDIDLTDHPFGNAPTTVAARLEIQGHGYLNGSCTAYPHH